MKRKLNAFQAHEERDNQIDLCEILGGIISLDYAV